MKHLGLFAFGVTTCVLVPTALHWLDAGPKQVAKLVAPGARTLTIGKTKVDVAVDRSFLDPGDKLHVTLTATAEGHERVTLAVVVFESTGSGGGRVETPPDRVGRDEVTLDTRHGTATKTFAFTLPGNRGELMDGISAFGHYTILVMPPNDADQLERLRRRATRVENPMNDESGQFGKFETAYRGLGEPPPTNAEDAFGTPGQIARLDVNTRPRGSAVSIVAPDTAKVGDALAIKVRVHNPSKLPLEKVTVSLDSKPSGIDNDYLGLADDEVTIDGGEQVAFAGHETKDIVFHVTATAAGTLGLFARARCEDCYQDPTAQGINDVALDAVEIGEAPAPVVGVQ